MNSKHLKFNTQYCSRRGFTLVEMIVAIGLFTIVLFIASSAFLSVLDADRKSRATRIAMDNLNLSLEDMARRIKTGTSYFCDGTVLSSGTRDCPSGGNSIAFTEQGGITRTAYRLDTTTGVIKRTRGSGTELSVTAPEITISNLKFIVSGSTIWDPLDRDTDQPYVTILAEGTTVGKVTTAFSIQTTVAQRAYDI